jgi:hypothetical protein
MNKTTRWMVLAAMLWLFLPALAVDPPGLMNYQGVLRDDNDVPLAGTYDMIFRFFDDADPAAPENEILVDEHLAAGTGAVTVTGGLFDVLLGSGNFYDGSGPGDHPHIFYVFGLHETVYLEVQVGAETLAPRMQVVSAPYAIHAVLLGGYAPSEFINTTSEEQEKTGLLRTLGGVDFGDGAHDDLTAAEVTGLTGGPATYADFLHQHAYADNADTLDDKHADEFIDTSSTSQTKNGMLNIDSGSQYATTALSARGHARGGYFHSAGWSGYATVASFDSGIRAVGETAGGEFENFLHGSDAWLANASYGIEANGPGAGGYFTTDAGSGYAYVGYLDEGISAHGDVQGGYFEDNDGTSNAHIAYGARGVEAYGQEYGVYAEGNSAGARFENSAAFSGQASIATADYGILASGDVAGGSFTDLGATRFARLAYYNAGTGLTYGIKAKADDIGGSFETLFGTGTAELAVGDIGIEASGQDAGGYFEDKDGTSSAHVAYGHRGIEAYGQGAGGYFEDSDGTGKASVGISDTGIYTGGDLIGGHFYNSYGGATRALTYVAYRDPILATSYGIMAMGEDVGGHFFTSSGSGEADLAIGDRGMWGAGSWAGATFSDTVPHTEVFADVARVIDSVTYKVYGSGTNSFVQNHPQDPDKVVVYSSPEGDEVATYTRGTARLDAGEARIPLGTTFQWVTNPDVGLTAFLTPHGDCLGLYVESLTSDELVVRELGGGVSDVRFDYFVMGLRIGFEQAPIVQAKDREAPLPAAGLGAEFYGDLLDPDAHTALQRFRQMEADVRGVAIEEVDLSGAASLREAIKASAWQQIGMSPDGERTVVVDENVPRSDSRDEAIRPGTRGAAHDRTRFDRPAFIKQDPSEASPDETPASQSEGSLFPVSEPVEIGDLLALDPEDPGVLRRADSAADPNVIGIVVEQPIETDEGDQAPVALYGLAVVNADASHGAILPGDLLVSSPTPGHVMRATVAAPGTVVGKALEPIETGTGSIQVLVMQR